jgi:hypothetical protein
MWRRLKQDRNQHYNDLDLPVLDRSQVYCPFPRTTSVVLLLDVP